MAKYTSLTLSDQLKRILDDPDGTNYKPQLVIDALNDAVDFVHTQLIGMHRKSIIDLYWPAVILKVENFSFRKTIDLPVDYLTWIDLHKDGTDEPIEIVPKKMVDRDPQTDDPRDEPYGAIFASNLSSPLPAAGNSGLDNFEITGYFSGSVDTQYVVDMDGIDTFRWSNDGGSTWETPATIAITGDWQALENDIEVKFTALTGYTIGDQWSFGGYVSKEVHQLKLNYTPTAHLKLQFARILAPILGISDTTYIPFERFYGAVRLFVELILLSKNEEDFRIEASVYAPVQKKLREIGLRANAGEKIRVEPEKTVEDYL